MRINIPLGLTFLFFNLEHFPVTNFQKQAHLRTGRFQGIRSKKGWDLLYANQSGPRKVQKIITVLTEL